MILAGGLGTRLRSAYSGPKCLAPVNGRPFLELQMGALAAQGIDHFVLALGHLSEVVLDAVAPLKARHRITHVIETQALGTGGAVLNAWAALGGDEALVTNGDTWLDAPLEPLLRPLDTYRGESMRLAAVRVEDRARYGGLMLDGDRVVGFVPKGAQGPGLINGGLYRMHRRAFDGMEPGSAFSLENVLMPALVERGQMTAMPVEGYFIDIGIPEDYRRFCASHG